jgi:hypothetical protein
MMPLLHMCSKPQQKEMKVMTHVLSMLDDSIIMYTEIRMTETSIQACYC